jgi:hypothetical protein
MNSETCVSVQYEQTDKVISSEERLCQNRAESSRAQRKWGLVMPSESSEASPPLDKIREDA